MNYYVYTLGPGGLRQLAYADELEAVGLMLETLHAEGDITSDDRVGLLRREEDDHGETVSASWIINPYAKGSAA